MTFKARDLWTDEVYTLTLGQFITGLINLWIVFWLYMAWMAEIRYWLQWLLN